MSAGTWGQLTVVAILLFAFPIYRVGRPWYVRLRLRRLIRNWNRSRRQHDEPLAYAMNADWERERRIARQRVLLRMADVMVEQGSEWQQRARRAEGLGFMDDVA